jgi:hypothetical protein
MEREPCGSLIEGLMVGWQPYISQKPWQMPVLPSPSPRSTQYSRLDRMIPERSASIKAFLAGMPYVCGIVTPQRDSDNVTHGEGEPLS